MGGFVSNAIEDIGNIGQGVIDAVGDAGAGIDRTVRDVVPGGWTTAALLAAGYYYQPEIAAFMNAEGAVVPAAEVAGGAGGAGAATGGGMFSSMTMPSMGQMGSALQIAGGINSLTGGGITNLLGGKSAVADATNAADPMAKYRQNLAAMYAGALQPGANLDPTQMPGYSQFETGVLNPALEASKRSSAASGMLRSGNEQIALQKIGQQGYSGFMTDYLNRLAAGSGVAQSPVYGYNAGSQAQTGIMQGIGGVGTGIAGIFGKKPDSTPTPASTNQFESGINTSGFYDTAPSDINMSGFYRAD
jgi:hypothetical protein